MNIKEIEVIDPEEIKNKFNHFNTVIMDKAIIKAAENYQDIDRQIKELEAKKKPLKKELIDFAVANKGKFDEAFQLKFPNGTYISQRVKDCIEGKKEDKHKLLQETENEFAKIELDEAAILDEAPKNGRLRKLLTKLGLKVSQKESFAIYAG